MMVILSRCKITKKKGKTTLKLLDNTLLLYIFLNRCRFFPSLLCCVRYFIESSTKVSGIKSRALLNSYTPLVPYNNTRMGL